MRIIVLVLCFIFLSCASVDVEKNIRDAGAGRQENGGMENPLAQIILEPEVVVVEKPVFVPEKETPPAKTPPGVSTVRESNSAGIVKPSEYSHAAMVYDYDPDWVYEIYAQPLRVCDIALEPGERAVEPPFISDSERWILGAGVSYEKDVPVQHIYVKPSETALTASLIINTDRRVYHVILRSYETVHMPMIRWRYRSGFPNNFFSPQRPADSPGAPADVQNTPGIDPRFLSFNYRITYSLFKKPVWLPELAFDDGSKTYITFPNMVLQRELPAVFENRRDIVNYRVNGNVVIIDKLIESITVKIQRIEVTIVKKRR
ncbi:MAG: TrbG/VirB9 family P-type conjugative transfer protein [Treponema sp.]|jgi:type IV secretion system protein VirB9|nr:TrbG/VirB9 family P-type conjugative transfer protein [Treponema sp.]